jgi:hypothetical protein
MGFFDDLALNEAFLAGRGQVGEPQRMPQFCHEPVADESIHESESWTLPTFCRPDCDAHVTGWCTSSPRNAFVNLDAMHHCPRNPERNAAPKYRIVEELA